MNRVREAYEAVRLQVLGLRDPATGVWTGELASSALSTALASVALGNGPSEDRLLAEAGASWLVRHADADGGWGDTPESASNLSTTLLAVAALRHVFAGAQGSGSGVREHADADKGCANPVLVVSRAEAWLKGRTGSLDAQAIARSLGQVYGEDRTFAVPILAFLAMCGEEDAAWSSVPPLPFLLALLPQCVYRFFKLQVVSYALPALIAVGLCRHVCAARAHGRCAWGRFFARRLLRKLEALQPEHGGFLDAIPLTAFVVLALRHAGYGTHPAAQKGLAFLRHAARSDGSWAIDSNLRTWVTSLAARAVTAGGRQSAASHGSWCAQDAERVAAWLVRTQVKRRHPFTGARPGGWAWTDLPGGVPDADDTAGALMALKCLKSVGCVTDVSEAVRNGVCWLLALQNRDGGIPTFSKGWGKLPFDRSCPDISAHVLSALVAWDVPGCGAAVSRLIRYLEQAQEADGSWVALWFGHQEVVGGKNPVVGTARVVDALRGYRGSACFVSPAEVLLARGESWLVAAQKADGGWSAGKAATVEETALAVIALTGGKGACEQAVRRGCGWLATHWQAGAERPAPIGLYFSLLWYHEKMYPLVWTLEALGRNLESL